jgi:mannitol 2-dehydrogenase
MVVVSEDVNSDGGLIKLCGKTARELSIQVPEYDREKVVPGIVHFGVGGFHRSHQALYIDKLLAMDPTIPFGIVGVGVMSNDYLMRDALVAQDCLYTLVEQRSGQNDASVVGSIIDVLFAPRQSDEAFAILTAETTKIVTLTITEGGYCINQATSELRLDLEGIQHDIKNPSAPKTVFGFIVEALKRRRQLNIPPFTVLSCDNLQENGSITQRVILSLARESDSELAAWIEENVAFPNSMVDRITPASTEEQIRIVQESYGIVDACPVFCEPFTQWVIEDSFCNDRPQWEAVGVQMVDNVLPYEKMKIRLLNASHSLMGYLGYLAGYKFIFQIAQDAEFQQYVRDFMNEEATPVIGEISGINLSEYKDTLMQRFANPAIRDEARRICLDGSGKIPKFVLPTIREQLRNGGDIKRGTLCVAAWFRYLAGTDESGAHYTIEDPMAAQLQELANEGREDPTPLLSVREVFDDELRSSSAFVTELKQALSSLYAVGARATLKKYL